VAIGPSREFLVIHRFRQGDREGTVDIQRTDDTVTVERDGRSVTFQATRTPAGFVLLKKFRVFNVAIGHKDRDQVEVFVNGQPIPLFWVDERKFQTEGPGAEAASGEIRAVMPGRVVRLNVRPGDLLKAGDPVAVLEAMKMENEIKSRAEGVVEEVCVAVGQTVENRALLVRLRAGG